MLPLLQTSFRARYKHHCMFSWVHPIFWYFRFVCVCVCVCVCFLLLQRLAFFRQLRSFFCSLVFYTIVFKSTTIKVYTTLLLLYYYKLAAFDIVVQNCDRASSTTTRFIHNIAKLLVTVFKANNNNNNNIKNSTKIGRIYFFTTSFTTFYI